MDIGNTGEEGQGPSGTDKKELEKGRSCLCTLGCNS